MYGFAYRLPVKRLKLIMVEVARIFVEINSILYINLGFINLNTFVILFFSKIGNEIIVNNEC